MEELIVLNQFIQKQELANPLSRIQRIVCKWFKITPQKLYWCIIRVNLSDVSKIRLDDILTADMNLMWYVLKIYSDGSIDITNVEAKPEIPLIKTLIYFGSACREF